MKPDQTKKPAADGACGRMEELRCCPYRTPSLASRQ